MIAQQFGELIFSVIWHFQYLWSYDLMALHKYVYYYYDDDYFLPSVAYDPEGWQKLDHQ